MTLKLTLASGSRIRADLLRNAGLDFEIKKSQVDEDSLKESMRAEGLSPKEQAEFLAEMKSCRVSAQTKGLVIGADQMMSLDGQGFDKPANREEAFERLKQFSGKAHHLESAIVIAQDGKPVWRHVNRPKLTMRPLSDAFIEDYLDRIGDAAFESVGAYQLEGLGVQLFNRIDGDYFSILGLPLIELLSFLRDRGDLPE
ncbi:Maf family protein [Ponticaulis profundi]|uniref:Nucleoside triphosphate pyrophosphatase n=1 Tax=Ponticaulis profundi TaxID=2665222 RepID=A0ABW1S944_9PROT